MLTVKPRQVANDAKNNRNYHQRPSKKGARDHAGPFLPKDLPGQFAQAEAASRRQQCDRQRVEPPCRGQVAMSQLVQGAQGAAARTVQAGESMERTNGINRALGRVKQKQDGGPAARPARRPASSRLRQGGIGNELSTRSTEWRAVKRLAGASDCKPKYQACYPDEQGKAAQNDPGHGHATAAFDLDVA